MTVGQRNLPSHCPKAADKAGAAQGNEQQGVLLKVSMELFPDSSCWAAAVLPAGSGMSSRIRDIPGTQERPGSSWGLPAPGGVTAGAVSASLTLANRIPPNAKLFFEVELVDIE